MFTFLTLSFLICLFFLVILSIEDYRHKQISHLTLFIGTVLVLSISVAYSIYSKNISPLKYSLISALVLMLMGIILYFFRCWGGGDLKVMPIIGLSLGLQTTIIGAFSRLILFLVIMILVAAVPAVIFIIKNKGKTTTDKPIAFIPFMTIAYAVTVTTIII